MVARSSYTHTGVHCNSSEVHTRTRTLLTVVAGLILALLRHCGDVQLRHHLVEVSSPVGCHITEGSALTVGGGAMGHFSVLSARGAAI